MEYIIPFHLIFTSITEAFYLSIKLSIILSLLYSIPFFYWQFYEFIIVGLYEYEKSELINWKSIVVTLICLIFSFKKVLLLILYFFIQFESEYLTLTLTFTNFIDFMNQTFFLLILIFTIPLVIKYLRHSFIRKINYFICLVLLALVTPPDLISLILTFIPIFIITELILFYYELLKNYS